jgi:hypothetical protein
LRARVCKDFCLCDSKQLLILCLPPKVAVNLIQILIPVEAIP